jgi:excisionase family DNA binding protein
MEAFLITKTDYQVLSKKITDIEAKLDSALPFLGNSTKKYLSITETCSMLNISKRTLQRYRDTGLLTFSQIGNKIYFTLEDIQHFMEDNKVK